MVEVVVVAVEVVVVAVEVVVVVVVEVVVDMVVMAVEVMVVVVEVVVVTVKVVVVVEETKLCEMNLTQLHLFNHHHHFDCDHHHFDHHFDLDHHHHHPSLAQNARWRGFILFFFPTTVSPPVNPSLASFVIGGVLFLNVYDLL